MARMSAVWDQTAAAIAGRAPVLAGIALPIVWLPGVVLSAVRFATYGAAADAADGAGSPDLMLLLAIPVAVFAAIGHLALVAAAGDAAPSRGDALRLALHRLGPYLGCVLLLVAVAALLMVPVGIALAGAYPSLAAMQAGAPPQLSGGATAFLVLYGLLLLVAVVVAEARLLSVLAPVIVHERLGLGSFARAIRLTRGLTWRIVGVVLLFALVALVTVLATRSVVFVALRLLLGAGGLATALFVTSAIVALVGCALAAVTAAFTARLYLATRAEQPAA